MKVDIEATLALVFVALMTLTAIVLNMPSPTPYSPYNSGSKGYAKLFSLFDVEVGTLAEASSRRDTAILMPVERESDPSSYARVRDLLLSGSTIVLLDGDGYSNPLLDFLGLRVRIGGYRILDEVSKLGSRDYPVASIKVGNTSYRVVVYRPSYIDVDYLDVELAGITSNYSYADLDSNGYYSIGEEMRRYVVIYPAAVGNGTIWIVSNLDIFSNELVDKLDNIVFLKKLVGGRRLYLVVDGLELGSLDVAKYSLYRVSLRYMYSESLQLNLAIFIAVLAILMVMEFAEQKK